VATANAQSAANKETAIAQSQLNMVNQNTPWGSLAYSQRGEGPDGTPLYQANVSLDPRQQQLLDLQTDTGILTNATGQQLLNNARGQLSQPINLSGLGAAPQFDENARSAALARILARANPELDRQRESIETRLATQGINVGSEAYRSGVDEYNRARNDFTLGADVQAGDEAARLFGLQMQGRNQGINEMLLPRQLTINELAALTGGSQVQMPQFQSTPQTGIAPTDVIGPQNTAYQGQLAGWNASNQRNNAMMGGLFGLGAAALPVLLSDRRAKTNIRKVGKLDNGLPVYAFRYKAGGPEQIGLMAQDVEKANPAAVQTLDGMKHVDYAKAVL
jgi:hypothetical protein